jgi:anti-sigma regulatory factor (Ser/Thr protein kinase)
MVVVSELVTNAFVHGCGRITLNTSLADGTLRIEVVDEGTGNAPTIREEGADDASGGWGLRIVDTLALNWGAAEGTTHVWADMATV